MTNAERIKALRYCAEHEGCDYYIAKDCPREETWVCGVDCEQILMRDAADALEAAEAREKAWTQKCERLEKRIAELEARLPKQGKWISDLPNGLFENVNPWKCSVCGKHQHFREDYCPSCGARMRKGKQNE